MLVNMLHFLLKLSIGVFFSAVNKIVVQAQLFCGYSNSAELPGINRSAALKIGIQTGTMTVSSELSSSVLMNWECDYPLNKFKPDTQIS